MKDFFSILRSYRLTTPRAVATKVMAGLSLPELLALASELNAAIPETPREAQTEQFAFLGDSEMVGHRGGCVHWECRLERATSAARFAALYCDTLYIPNSFSAYPPVSNQATVNSASESPLRYALAGDILLALAVRPCMDAGVMKYVRTSYHFCEECSRRLAIPRVEAKLRKAVDALEEEYSPKTKGTYVCLGNMPFGSDGVEVSGPPELFEHPRVGLLSEPPPGIRRNPDRKVRLTQEQLRSTGLVRARLEAYARDLKFQNLLGRILGTSYLTHRVIDARLLACLDQRYAATTASLERALACELPFVQGASLKSLLNLRRKEEEAFDVFRHTLSSQVRRHVASRGGRVDLADARMLYRDVVAPELAKVDLKVKKAANGNLFAGLRDIAVMGGILSMGVYFGQLHGPAENVVKTLGAVQVARDVVKAFSQARRGAGEVQAHEWYYLWRLGKKLGRRR